MLTNSTVFHIISIHSYHRSKPSSLSIETPLVIHLVSASSITSTFDSNHKYKRSFCHSWDLRKRHNARTTIQFSISSREFTTPRIRYKTRRTSYLSWNKTIPKLSQHTRRGSNVCYTKPKAKSSLKIARLPLTDKALFHRLAKLFDRSLTYHKTTPRTHEWSYG
jgi:hypothetical protein